MLKFKDIVRCICATVIYLCIYIKNLFKMESVYDCARPFLLVAGIFGIGGSNICAIEGVRSVRNTKFSLVIAALITLVITPYFFQLIFRLLFLSGEQRSLVSSTSLIISSGQFLFIIYTAAVICIRTHIDCKNLTKVLKILNDTDMMLKQANIHVNYWKIALKTILFGLISCQHPELYSAVYRLLWNISPASTAPAIAKLLINSASQCYFMWLMLFLLIIRERFAGLNKLLLQNAQVPSIMQDDSLLRRISLARDIHEQLSEAIALFSDISRLLIIGVFVPGMLRSLFNALRAAVGWSEIVRPGKGDNLPLIYVILVYFYYVVFPIMQIVILSAVCEGHKDNRRVLTARLRHLIAHEEDPRTVQQLQQYIWFNYDTVPGLVDFQLADVDFTLLFTVIDILVNYMFVIWSHFRISVQGETM